MTIKSLLIAISSFTLFSCAQTTHSDPSHSAFAPRSAGANVAADFSRPLDDQLVRHSFLSSLDNSERDYFVYLPRGYDKNPNKKWPVLLFLHGNGERGNGKSELGYVLKHGPLYEAWIQKKPLDFIIIAPQLPMFGMDKYADYLKNRDITSIPQRLPQSIPTREPDFVTSEPMAQELAIKDMSNIKPLLPMGWEQIENDLLQMLKDVAQHYHTDQTRVYLSGLSYGGFGTWYMASKHPEMFAAIAPVVGWGHPTLMAPIAKAQLPVWAFAGGRDRVILAKHFFAGINKLEALGHQQVQFTIHQDMGHDAWKRVYAGDDLYNWFLQHKKPRPQQ
ncbi:alpha/beta hydrolase-fold protein [Thalassotalea aquiviva]|uniref:carboxylesterase family protein n=1 Tax=Thalassotalea aquiviva TaxID=3242415 RepID=UPI00352B6FC4